MGRRKKDVKPPISSAWESYKPDDALYYRHGGQAVPPEDIPPTPFGTDYFVSHLKHPGKKVAYSIDLLARAQTDLAEAIADQARYAELGIDAMKHEFQRDQDRELMEGEWSPHVARNVDRHRASFYITIRQRKGQVANCKATIDRLEAETLPLLFGRGTKKPGGSDGAEA